jgi:hypothetical protein
MWLSCQLGGSSAAQWIFENKVLKNTVVRAPSLRETMLSTMKEVVLPTIDGNISATQFEIPRERVEQFVIRVTKGLITKYFPEHDYFDAAFNAKHIPSTIESLTHLETVKNTLRYDSGVFEFRYGLTDSGQSGVWILVFYECAIFLVVHTKNNLGKPVT